jgi:2-dehydropantoate 2-reductase
VRFAVLGDGAIGAYVGAALARGGADVTLIARGEHLRAMTAHGVRVLSARGDFTVHPEATDDISAVADADVVFVALKAYSLTEIAPRLGSLLAPGAAANCSTEIVEPGVIRHVEGTRFTLGEPDGTDSERCRLIAAAFTAGQLRAPLESRLRDQIWLKLVGNVAFNPITALTGATLGEVGTVPEMRDLLRAIFGSRSRSRSIGGSKQESRSETTGRRCSRISRRGSGSSSAV